MNSANMFTQRRRSLPKAEMNVVPFLDVLLVLLLILMATTPAIHHNIQVDLPTAMSAKQTVDPAAGVPVILEVSGADRYSLIIQGRRLEGLSSQQIMLQTKAQLRQNPQQLFLIGGSATVAYEEVLKGLSLVQQAGVTTVGLMTRPL